MLPRWPAEWCSRSVLILCVNPQPPGSLRGIGGAEAESKVAPEKLFWLSLALLSCHTVHPGRPDQRGHHCWRFGQTWSPTTTAVHFRPGQNALTAQRRARASLRSIRQMRALRAVSDRDPARSLVGLARTISARLSAKAPTNKRASISTSSVVPPALSNN